MKMHSTVLAVAVSILASQIGSLHAAEYSQTFDFPDGTTDLGDGSWIGSSTNSASIQGGRLQLTRDDTGSSLASFHIPSLGAEATQSWIASFDLNMFDEPGGNNPADGLAFSYGPIPAETNAGEEGFGVGLSIEFDTWSNGTEHADLGGYQIAVNGQNLDDAFLEDDPPTDGVTRRAIFIYSEGNVNVRLGDEVILQGVVAEGFEPQEDFNFAFGARTGGATEDVFIDNLLIQAPLPGNPGDFNEDGAIDLADFQILLDNFNQPGGSSKGDTNFSFTVDLKDFINFRDAFNAQGAAAAGVPEPAGLLLGLMGIAVLGRMRQNRRIEVTKFLS